MSTAKVAPHQICHYNLKSGKRSTAKYALTNPDKVQSFTFPTTGVPIRFLERGETTPATLDNASAAFLALKTKNAQLALRRARYAAKKAGESFEQVTTAPKKRAKKQIIHKSAVDGKLVSNKFARLHPDTTFATAGKRKPAAKKVKPASK